MMNFIYAWPTTATCSGLLLLMFLGNELGFRLGRHRMSKETERSHAVSAGLKASVIGLVALLIGFSFSMTTNRFSERQHLVLDEANAIGTCYLRAGLLADPARTEIRQTLRQYTETRIRYFEEALHLEESRHISQEMDADMEALWQEVETAAAADLQAVHFSQIIPAANEVIDLNSTRAWASQNQTPGSVIMLLAVCSVVATTLMGHSSGQAGVRHVGLWIALNVLIVLVLYVILDFDRPRRGLIQLNHQPLIDLRESLKSPRMNSGP